MHSPDTEVVVAFSSRVAMAVWVQLVVLELIGIPLLDLLVREAVDVSRIELVHLLAFDDLVAEIRDGLAGGETATASRGPDLYVKRREQAGEGQDGESLAHSQSSLRSLLSGLHALLQQFSTLVDDKVSQLVGVVESSGREVRVGLVRVLDEGLAGLLANMISGGPEAYETRYTPSRTR
jgi:hypothetical protein